ncbi:hypothetical protein CVIRNUC_007977 [Coccomyxa viridis]|uniref:Phytocyanin domain-containing protein n=1 Tax=Coccomyxa viridis TaxID=1274662 RepID=A0AAV1IBR0_9CHLO|nr:hypothetical protein CVIRNUC_007977 [Coccomyxa viridis]
MAMMQGSFRAVALTVTLIAGLVYVAQSTADPSGPIHWYIPKAVNKPPYANGTAMVGDSVMYTWKGFFHGVVLSTSSNCTDKAAHMQVPGGMDATAGNATVTFKEPGTFYVLCPVGQHCSEGQIQRWDVTSPLSAEG